MATGLNGTNDARLGKDNPEKLVNKFTWDAVDPELARRLLIAAYRQQGAVEDIDEISALANGPLARQAARSLGSPPDKTHMQALFPVLRDYWVPRLRGKFLDELAMRMSTTMSAADRQESLRTMTQKHLFLQSKSSTENSRANFRAVFVRAHKEPLPVRSSGGSSLITDDRGITPLVGQGASLEYTPYAHQRDAWIWLDELSAGATSSERAGLLVLPTGAGKTTTAVDWVVRRMAADASVRVLWIAHQQELLEQAGRTLVTAASAQVDNFYRSMRLLVGGGPGLATLTEPDLDVALTSRQLLTAAGRKGQTRLTKYLSARPTIVIVDEAHHAVSPTYDAILTLVSNCPTTTLVGLTATPWPTAVGARKRLRERFPHEPFVVQVESLIQSGVLATPIFHTVATHEKIVMTAEEQKVAGSRDLPPQVLRKLATRARDEVIVRAWTRNAEQWGKTLVFATSIEHADRLTGAFRLRKVDAGCIHSQVGDPAAVLAQFRDPTGQPVLVSVGMLTEGVDVPAARTAFLARPTTSTILMRQMIGRVLRGPDAGGDPYAHIVYLRDQWGDFLDIVEPPDVSAGTTGPSQGPAKGNLPSVRDDTGQIVAADLLRRLFDDAERAQVATPFSIATTAAELVGYYELGDTNLPVLAHQEAGYADLIKFTLSGGTFQGTGALSYFEGQPPPYPGKRGLASLVDWIREYDTEPSFHALHASFDPRRVAQELRAARAMTVDQRSEWLRDRFEECAIGSLYVDFAAFEEAVEDAIRDLQRATTGRRPHDNPEAPLPEPTARRLRPLPSSPTTRDLPALLAKVAERARSLLADELAEDGDLDALLDVGELPVRFSRKPIRDAWAYWAQRFRGPAAGRPMIVVNCLLDSSPDAVPDTVLEYLLYHELLHHLLPGQGHDGQFRRLEDLWPDIDQAELLLMTLHERWDTRVRLEGGLPQNVQSS